MEAFAVEGHERAIRARAEGRFESEIAPVGEVSQDEGPREPNWTKIRSLPTLVEGGRVTAAVASQISDASASLLIVSEQALADPGLTPRADPKSVVWGKSVDVRDDVGGRRTIKKKH